MKARVQKLTGSDDERVEIGTFHSFCAQILRQHGVHVGIRPDFVIYSSPEDRAAILRDAIRSYGGIEEFPEDVAAYLPVFDRLKSDLVPAAEASVALGHLSSGQTIAVAYQLYEREMRNLGALDFTSLIFEAYALLKKYPAIARSYAKVYRYWMMDEFQDTTNAQYELLLALSDGQFHDVMAVADDDQLIYAWNGASFAHLKSFVEHFDSEVLQLPTNFRCPPAIVDAANRLVVFNTQRSAGKAPAVPGKTAVAYPREHQIEVREFTDDRAEARGIANEIERSGRESWDRTVVLARNRSLLSGVVSELMDLGVPAALTQRRDTFLSAEFRWFVAVLKQCVRPLDQRNLAALVQAFNRFGETEVEVDQILAESESTGRSYLRTWLESVGGASLSPNLTQNLVAMVSPLTHGEAAVQGVIGEFLTWVREKLDDGGDRDIAEDYEAWNEVTRDIVLVRGRQLSLDEFLREMDLRSKEPSPKSGTVSLMTIHSAKGKEFDFVYLIGLAEDILPSYQSRRRGSHSSELEEERRNCFVAITRVKERLVLSRAHKYRGWDKAPSRFLQEMGLA